MMLINLTERKLLHKLDIEALESVITNEYGFCMDLTYSGSLIVEFVKDGLRAYYNGVLVGCGMEDEIVMLLDLFDFFHRRDDWDDYNNVSVLLKRMTMHDNIEKYIQALKHRGVKYAKESVHWRTK